MQNGIPNFTPLTGVFTGTANSDTYSKTLSIFGLSPDLDAAVNGAIASNLNIRSFAGDDTVDIDASVTGKDIPAVGLFGLEYGDINTGADNDTVLIRGLINSSSSTTIPVAFFQGIRGSTLLTGTGEDTVVISSTVTLDNSTNFQNARANSFGLQTTTLNTGADNDTVTVESLAIAAREGRATGLEISQITTGQGVDTVRVNVSATGAPFGSGEAIGLKNSSIVAGKDDDRVSIAVESDGFDTIGRRSSGIAVGLSESQVFGDQGQDIISLDVQASANAKGLSSASISGGGDNDIISVTAGGIRGNVVRIKNNQWANGLDAASRISGGGGHDEITIATSSSGSNVVESVGTKDSWVFGDNGNDTITLLVTGNSQVIGSKNGLRFTNPDVYGSLNTLIDGGAGNDELIIQVSATLDDAGLPPKGDSLNNNSIPPGANQGDIFGVLESTVVGGRGRDTISITSEVSLVGNPVNFNPSSIGAVSSTIDAGDGRDTIVIQGVNLDIDDVIVSGGSGNDVFDVGIGSGNIYGNGGRDRIKLDFFDSATMTIELLGQDSIRIVGTQDKLGNSLDWTQTIEDMEQFEVSGTVYNATDVAALLG